MPACQRIGPLEGEADPLPAAVTAKWGPFGRRRRCSGNSGRATPSLRHPAAAHSHPDCRGIPILIVALHDSIASSTRIRFSVHTGVPQRSLPASWCIFP